MCWTLAPAKPSCAKPVDLLAQKNCIHIFIQNNLDLQQPIYVTTYNMNWLDEIRWTSDGLIPVIAQETGNGRVMMFAWMNRESLSLTAEEGYAVYWSRSRGKLWRKGEESGHRQKVISIQLDCDEDVILLEIEQEGGIACHTGRQSCFYRQLLNGQWQTFDPVIKNPEEIYPTVTSS